MIVAPTASTGNTTVVTGVYLKPPYTVQWKTPYWSSLGISPPSSQLVYQFTFQGCSGSLSDSACSGSVVNTFVLGLTWASGQPQSFYLTLLDWYVGTGNSVSVTIQTYNDANQHIVKADFNGTYLTVSIDGQTFIQTNLLKQPLPIYNITLNATVGNNPYVNNRAVSYLDVVTGIDWSSLLNAILPIAIVVGVIASALVVFRRIRA